MVSKVKLAIMSGLGLLVMGGTLTGVYAHNSALEKAKNVINSAEKGKDTTDINLLKTHQQSLQQEIQLLEKIPQIPVIINYPEFQNQLQKMRSLLPQIVANTNSSEALHTAEKKAMEAAVLVQNSPHPLATWQQAETKWYESITMLQGIDTNSPAGKVAQEKLGAYINNYQVIGQRVVKAEQAIALNNQGVNAMSAGNLPQAISHFTNAIAMNPALAEAHMGRGITQAQLGNYPQALPDLDQAVKLNPQLAEAYFQRGMTHYKLGKPDQAIADYTKVTQLDGNYGTAYLEKGAIQYKSGQLQPAMEDFQKALQIFTTNGDTNNLKITQELLAKLPAIPANVSQELESCESSWQDTNLTKPCYFKDNPAIEADFDRRPNYYRTRYPSYYEYYTTRRIFINNSKANKNPSTQSNKTNSNSSKNTNNSSTNNSTKKDSSRNNSGSSRSSSGGRSGRK